MKEVISTYGIPTLRCPYCGEDNDDSDYRHDFEWKCSYCGQVFRVEADYDPCYYTFKLEEEADV